MTMRGPMRWLPLRLASALLAGVALAACGDSTEPEPSVAGPWELSLVNGQAVPSVYLTYGLTGATKWVLGGSLDFLSGGSVVDARELRDQTYQQPPVDFTTSGSYSYRVLGDRVIISRPNPAAPSTTYADTGFVDGNVMYITVRTVDGTPNQARAFTYVKGQ